DLVGEAGEETLFQKGAATKEEGEQAAVVLHRERHRVIGKATDDFARNNFNTAIAAIMELANTTGDYLRKVSFEVRAESDILHTLDVEVAETLVRLMAPMAPHWAEEAWQVILGHDTSVHLQSWPTFDPEQAKADEVELAVQVNGKVKARITVASDAAEEVVRTQALEAVAAVVDGKSIVKAIVIPGRLVNIVIK
ncbi:MAG: class I tRNA ligase family protein, partial [Raoultibacter sp.]